MQYVKRSEIKTVLPKSEINHKRFPNKPLYFVPSVNNLRSCDTDHIDVAAKLISITSVLPNHHTYLSHSFLLNFCFVEANKYFSTHFQTLIHAPGVYQGSIR